MGRSVACVAALVVIGVASSGDDQSGGSSSASSPPLADEAAEEAGPSVTGKVEGRFNRDRFVCDETLASSVIESG